MLYNAKLAMGTGYIYGVLDVYKINKKWRFCFSVRPEKNAKILNKKDRNIFKLIRRNIIPFSKTIYTYDYGCMKMFSVDNEDGKIIVDSNVHKFETKQDALREASTYLISPL